MSAIVLNKFWFVPTSGNLSYKLAPDTDNSMHVFQRIDGSSKLSQPDISDKEPSEKARPGIAKDGMESQGVRRNSTARETGRLTAVEEIQQLLNQDDMVEMENLSQEEKHQQTSDNRTSRCVKTLHMFAIIERLPAIPEMKHFLKLLNSSNEIHHAVDVDCISRGYECDLKLSVGSNVASARGKDAVIFGMMIWYWKREVLQQLLKQGPEPGQTWIFYSSEPPHRVVDALKPANITALLYHVLMTYRSDSDIRVPFGYFRPFSGYEDGPKDTRFRDDEFYTNRTGLMSWVGSNCKQVRWPRMPFIEKLQKLMPLDTYGGCGTKECLPRRSEKCNKLFASYKFYLAVPNAECQDYITEKFWLISLKSGTVPVVLGARKEDYEKVGPPNSYVHIGDFRNLSDLAQYLKQVDMDDNLYRKYHEWRNQGEVVPIFPYKPTTMCRTIRHIYKREPNEFKYLGDSPWFRGCRHMPDKKFMHESFQNLENWTIW